MSMVVNGADPFRLIQNVVSRYTICVNRRDWSALPALFAPDAVWEAPAVPGAMFVGRDAIVEGIPALVGSTHTLLQLNTPSVILIDGARATAECSIRETGTILATNMRFEAHGIYEDQLVLRDGAWLFLRRSFTLLENWHVPLPAPASASPPAQP